MHIFQPNNVFQIAWTLCMRNVCLLKTGILGQHMLISIVSIAKFKMMRTSPNMFLVMILLKKNRH